MRCKKCKTAVFAAELMPRIIAITGEPGTDSAGLDNWDFAPEIRDSDEYEASTTIGFGCDDANCPNWYGNVGNLTKANHGSEWWTLGNELSDVAEKGKPKT